MKLPERSVNANWKQRIVRLCCLLFSIIAISLINIAFPTLEKSLDEALTDLVWQISASKKIERRIVLIDIGESSIKDVGPWPWPRQKMAELSNQLKHHGVSQQVYDVIFESPRDGDLEFAESLAATSSILAQVFVVEHGAVVQSGKLVGGVNNCPKTWAQASGYIAPNEQLAAVSKVGHITPSIDHDGAVRQLPAMVCYNAHSYPSLSLAALIEPSKDLQVSKSNNWLAPTYKLHANGRAIPLSDTGNVRIPYRIHPDGFIAVSAADVLAGNVPKDLLRNSIAIIGSTALGGNDAVPTPFNGTTAGMLVHAELLAGILDQRIPYTPQGEKLLQLLIFIVLGSSLILLASRTQRANIFLPLLGGISIVIVMSLHITLLLTADIWVAWSNIALSLMLLAVLLAIHEHWRSRIERERLYSHLSSYLPTAVATALSNQNPSGAVQAARREVTVLIADIRNFSAYCESAPAEEVAAVLHAFIITAQKTIEAQGGVVEAVHGDSILALWPQHDTRAVQAARELLKLAPKFLPDVSSYDLEPLSLGVGLEAGPALIGSVGPIQRRTHTAMGITVTTAARLQSMTCDLAEGILVGPVLAKTLPETQLRSLGRFLLEGMRKPKDVFGIVAVQYTV